MKEYLNKVHNCDCLELLKKLPDNSVDCIVTDPPYELGFMNKKWDSTGISYNVDLWRECLRVLKSGGHLLAFGGSRTYHRMACAIEDAGFEIRDQIQWLYGSGFPKSLNISKAIDKMQGIKHPENKVISENTAMSGANYTRNKMEIKSELAKQWDGWGTALKPAYEPICMARKPLSEKTACDNVLKYGTGGINIDACRINIDKQKETDNRVGTDIKRGDKEGLKSTSIFKCTEKGVQMYKENGRFPSNVILSHHNECVEIGVKEVNGISGGTNKTGNNFMGKYKQGHKPFNYAKNGKEIVSHYECHPDCPIGILDKQSGVRPSSGRIGESGSGIGAINGIYQKGMGGKRMDTYFDIGTASRFFYCAKSSRAERNKGCENLEDKKQRANYKVSGGRSFKNGEWIENNSKPKLRQNFHPCVKPKKLMQYLIKLITPPNGIVLDIFAGSGSTLVACKSLGFDFIGIEKEQKYCQIAEARIKAEQAQGKFYL